MGNVKSLYSKNQYLYWYIQKGDHTKMDEHIKNNPGIVGQPMTRDCKTLPLNRASWRGDKKAIEVLLNNKADVNQVSENGETALMAASKRDRVEILKLLIENGADVNCISDLGLKAIEYSILAGYYDNVHYLYPMMTDKKLRTAKQYEEIAKKYKYRYVDYEALLKAIEKGLEPCQLGNIYIRPKKIYNDPVIDPRETWGQWFKRVADFRPAPLVERDELPENLQPQNRTLGKIHHFFDRMGGSRYSTPPQVHPSGAKSEIGPDMSQSQLMRQRKHQNEQVHSQL